MKMARPLKAIRLKCLDCSGWEWPEVARCQHTTCILWPLRFGKKPKGVAYSKVSAKDYEKRIQVGNFAELPVNDTVVEQSPQERGV